MAPLTLFDLLLKDSKIETLFKAQQYKIIRHALKSYLSPVAYLCEYWNSVKICIRNNYIIKDASMWCDYIGLLSYFGKDLQNAKYVCPTNLKKEHDKFLAKKRKIEAEERREQNRLKAIKDKKKLAKDRRLFKELKGKFFGIVMADKDLQIIVLDSVKEYKKEGDVLHHCVFDAKYHTKPETLILSARIGEKRIATIELSLETFEVVQCRGAHNSQPKQYKRILALVNKKIRLIKKQIAA